MKNRKGSLLESEGFRTFLSSMICILVGLLIGWVVLTIINPSGSGEAIITILLNFLTKSTGDRKSVV